MRTAMILLLVVGICALAFAETANKPLYKVVDKTFLNKQKDVLRLFNYINQPSYYKDFVDIAAAFNWEDLSQWTNPKYATTFWYRYQHDFLPKGQVFSVFNAEHLQQAIALFDTFYYAKDYDTFYRTAVWARQNVNAGIFIYAYSVAIVHGKYTHDIILPPIYEIYPHYFFNNEVINKAQLYKQHYWETYESHGSTNEDLSKGYTIQANYSGNFLDSHPEQVLSYFTEDVGINAYYYYYGIFAPRWLPSEINRHLTSHKGEFFYWYHQQFLARYYLERLSNNKGEIPQYSHDHPIETGHYPSLTYPNSIPFPSRPPHAEAHYRVHGNKNYQSLTDYERRLRDTLDLGFFWTPQGKLVGLYNKDGFETLGNLIESNRESNNAQYYGDLLSISRHLLGGPYNLLPSSLEHFETCVRDPMFYQLFRRVLGYFNQHQEWTGPYKREELKWEGVQIDDVSVDRLVTYFDNFDSDLSNAVSVNDREFNDNSVLIAARQYRLNHKPFNYKITVRSGKAVDAFVKVFIGPKLDEYGREIKIQQHRNHFFEVDRFRYSLVEGKNSIERNSHESHFFSHDRTSFLELYQQVLTSINGSVEFKYYPVSKYYGFPQRLLLPKGDLNGKVYQMFFVVVPCHANAKTVDDLYRNYFVDDLYSLGYPLDRPIENGQVYRDVSNFFFKDVVIYHKRTDVGVNTI